MPTKWIKDGYELVLHYKENVSGGEICEGQENSDWPDHEDSYVEFELLFISNINSNNYSGQYDIIYCDFNHSDIDKVYLVVVRYTDGDTFGTTRGNWYIESACKTEEEALKIGESIEDGSYKGYKPWEGFFSGFESVEVIEMEIRK